MGFGGRILNLCFRERTFLTVTMRVEKVIGDEKDMCSQVAKLLQVLGWIEKLNWMLNCLVT